MAFGDDKIVAVGGYTMFHAFNCRKTTSAGRPDFGGGWGTGSESATSNAPLDFCTVSDLVNLPGDLSVNHPFRAGVISACFVIASLAIAGAANLILDEKRRGYSTFRWLPAPWMLYAVSAVFQVCLVCESKLVCASGSGRYDCPAYSYRLPLQLCAWGSYLGIFRAYYTNITTLAVSGSFYGPGLGLVVVAFLLSIAAAIVSFVFRSEFNGGSRTATAPMALPRTTAGEELSANSKLQAASVPAATSARAELRAQGGGGDRPDETFDVPDNFTGTASAKLQAAPANTSARAELRAHGGGGDRPDETFDMPDNFTGTASAKLQAAPANTSARAELRAHGGGGDRPDETFSPPKLTV